MDVVKCWLVQVVGSDIRVGFEVCVWSANAQQSIGSPDSGHDLCKKSRVALEGATSTEDWCCSDLVTTLSNSQIEVLPTFLTQTATSAQ